MDEQRPLPLHARYREYLTLGPVADPEIIPDVWEFAGDLQAAYEELRAAAGLAPGTGR